MLATATTCARTAAQITRCVIPLNDHDSEVVDKVRDAVLRRYMALSLSNREGNKDHFRQGHFQRTSLLRLLHPKKLLLLFRPFSNLQRVSGAPSSRPVKHPEPIVIRFHQGKDRGPGFRPGPIRELPPLLFSENSSRGFSILPEILLSSQNKPDRIAFWGHLRHLGTWHRKQLYRQGMSASTHSPWSSSRGASSRHGNACKTGDGPRVRSR